MAFETVFSETTPLSPLTFDGRGSVETKTMVDDWLNREQDERVPSFALRIRPVPSAHVVGTADSCHGNCSWRSTSEDDKSDT